MVESSYMTRDLSDLQAKIAPVLKKHGIKKAGLFGSVARGEEGPKSDIDILIQPHKKMSLFDIFDVQEELEKLTKKNIDLVTYGSLQPMLKKGVIAHQLQIL